MKYAATVIFLFGCSSGPPPATQPSAIVTTLMDLAGPGNKHVGSDEGRQAGEYVLSRFQKLGLTNPHLESFGFPKHVVSSSSLAVTIAGAATPMAFEVFEGSGAGHVEGDLVWCGTAQPSELQPLNLTGKVALVQRSMSYHRSAQYNGVSQAGAVAMLYVSQADMNLIQVGSVRVDGWSALGPIPTVTVGKDDGAKMQQALMAGMVVHALFDVQASAVPATGNNVIATLPGSDASGQILIGAHYDTWFTGSVDNGGGVAALLALADRRMHRSKPKYTLVFVAYDGEEVSLYGGYDWLRKHHIVAQEPTLAVLNFEMPQSDKSSLNGLAHTSQPVLDMALVDQKLDILYGLYGPMELVPMLFGGVVPTDIQGMYRNGLPTVSTAANSPWYHTTADTPDKLDATLLAPTVDAFDDALQELLAQPTNAYSMRDAKIWNATLTPQPRSAGQPLTVAVALTDSSAHPQASAQVDATLMVDDFMPQATMHGVSDASGNLSFTFPAAAVEAGMGNRFLHVTAGPTYPFVEEILALP
jgi:aminopeptidase YwaD